jgi:hypothetical protein
LTIGIEVPATPTVGANVMLVGTPVVEKLTTLVAPSVIAPTPVLTALATIDKPVVAAAAAGSVIEKAPVVDVEVEADLSAPAGVEEPNAVTTAPDSGFPY